MEKVPLKSIKCGKLKKQANCALVLPEENVPRLEFLCRGINEDDNFKLQCENITAIDLRVETKFGSIEAMQGIILVECTVLETGSSRGSSSPLETSIQPSTSPSETNSTGGNCLVQAKFHVNETGAIRDLVRKLQHIYSNLNENTNIDHHVDQNNPQTTPKHFKEGLPQWVKFVPHSMYSKRTREWIQLTIYVYMVFSVIWALWQLYRYVDFVREAVRPLIDFLQYQYQLLDYVICFFNKIFEEYTVQWLCFIKPLHTVTTAIAAPVLQTLGQLSPVLRIVTQSVANGCSMLQPVVKPVLSIGYQLIYSICSIIAKLWGLYFDHSLPTLIRTYFGAFKNMLGALCQSFGQTQLDPLKAQLVYVRTTVMYSCKAIGLGMVRLARKIYMIIWLRRSTARVEKQE